MTEVTRHLAIGDVVMWMLNSKDNSNPDHYEFLPDCDIKLRINHNEARIPVPAAMMELARHCNVTVRTNDADGSFDLTGSKDDMMNLRLSWNDDWGYLA